jgi:hypothetical protein
MRFKTISTPELMAIDFSAPAEMMRLAERVRRLAPSHCDPERFHLDKSEIAAELRRLAREIAA